MNASIYIDSKTSTIRVEGPVSDMAVLLGTAAAQILRGYFPDDKDQQAAWIYGISYAAMQAVRSLDKEDAANED